MRILLANSWSTNRLAYISAWVSLSELMIFFLVAFFAPGPVAQSVALRRVIAITWVLGGPISFGFALLGLFIDSRRTLAFVALIFACVCWAFCTLQVLV
jgi:hypothetical protein